MLNPLCLVIVSLILIQGQGSERQLWGIVTTWPLPLPLSNISLFLALLTTNVSLGLPTVSYARGAALYANVYIQLGGLRFQASIN